MANTQLRYWKRPHFAIANATILSPQAKLALVNYDSRDVLPSPATLERGAKRPSPTTSMHFEMWILPQMVKLYQRRLSRPEFL